TVSNQRKDRNEEREQTPILTIARHIDMIGSIGGSLRPPTNANEKTTPPRLRHDCLSHCSADATPHSGRTDPSPLARRCSRCAGHSRQRNPHHYGLPAAHHAGRN